MTFRNLYLAENARLTNEFFGIPSMILEMNIRPLNLLIPLDLISVRHLKGSPGRLADASTLPGRP